jgi:hypothetical protein
MNKIIHYTYNLKSLLMNYVLCFVQVFIVTLWVNCDRFFQRLNTAAANDASTQSIIAEFFDQ